MQFLVIIIVLLLVSAMLAYRALVKMQRLTEIGEVKKELFKGKVVYKNDYSSSDESSSVS